MVLFLLHSFMDVRACANASASVSACVCVFMCDVEVSNHIVKTNLLLRE